MLFMVVEPFRNQDARAISHRLREKGRMIATDEGREKGEKWCKRAIWANTLPAFKHL